MMPIINHYLRGSFIIRYMKQAPPFTLQSPVSILNSTRTQFSFIIHVLRHHTTLRRGSSVLPVVAIYSGSGVSYTSGWNQCRGHGAQYQCYSYSATGPCSVVVATARRRNNINTIGKIMLMSIEKQNKKQQFVSVIHYVFVTTV